MTKLTKVGTPVHLKVTVPQTLCKEGRTLYALRCHEGKAALAAQGTGPEFEWATSEFSTHVVAYKDAASGSSSSISNGTARNVLPKTGDPASPWTVVALLLAASLFVGTGVVIRRKGTREF